MRINKILVIVLLLALIHGLLYVFIIPVWEHYDEPGNFEYAWLMAHRAGKLKYGDYDSVMRKAVLTSLINSQFFEKRGFPMARPNLTDDPAWIGVTQVEDPPIYFWLASLPMRLMPPMDVERQLYAGRLVSLIMYLITIFAGWGIAAELIPEGNAIRWMVPAMLALLPGFTDLMTAVNSDVGAVLFYTLWLWVAIRMLRRGFSFPLFIGLIFSTIVCLLTKKTVYLVLITAPVGLILTLVKGRWHILVWGIIGLVGIFGLTRMVKWDDPAGWYRTTNQPMAGRIAIIDQETDAPIQTSFALQTVVNPGTTAFRPAFSQPLSPDVVLTLQGKKVTISGLMWASSPLHTTTPAINLFGRWPANQNMILTHPVNLEITPKYFAVHYEIPENIQMIVLAVAPISENNSKGQVSVFYSHLVVAKGEYPLNELPQFTDSQERNGIWGGQPFTNLVYNSSNQGVWPRWNGSLYSWINQKLGSGTNTYGLIAYSLDPARYRFFTLGEAENLFRTFWAKFSWGQVYLIGEKPYRVLMGATAAGILGLAILIILRWRRMPWKITFFLTLVCALGWIYAWVIGIIIRPLTTPNFITAARYAYPAIVPTALALNAGWWEIGNLVKRWASWKMSLPRFIGPAVFYILFLALDVSALYSILLFYK